MIFFLIIHYPDNLITPFQGSDEHTFFFDGLCPSLGYYALSGLFVIYYIFKFNPSPH